MTSISFMVWGCPVPKQRARRGRKGQWYTPRKTQKYEEDVALAAMAAVRRAWPKDATYEVLVNQYFPDRRKRDIENVGKAVCDAMNKIVWDDDSQVAKLTNERYYDKERPRIEVTVIAR